MNPQDAGELVHLWVDAHDDPAEMTPHSGPVSRTLRELAPDGRPYAVAQTPSGPAMVILLDDALLVFQARALDDRNPPVSARLVRIDAGTELEVTERFEERQGAPLRMHSWQVRSSGAELRIDGAELVQPGIEPDFNEKVGRAIAEKLGWELP